MAKIFIGNIPHASGENELCEWVEAQGFQVTAAQIIRDRSTGLPRGFGFVTLAHAWQAKAAIAALNGQRMRGRILTVNEATPISRAPGSEAWRAQNPSNNENDSRRPQAGMKRVS